MLSISLVVGPCILLYLIYKYLIYPVFLSPLSKIPSAHFSSSFSSVWILLERHNEQENRAIHTAHVKYGDIVRLGPNEISVACVDEGIRTIYGGGFEKWNWYSDQFENYGWVVSSLILSIVHLPISHLSACLSIISQQNYTEPVKRTEHVLHDKKQTTLCPQANRRKSLLEVPPPVVTRSPQYLPSNPLRPSPPSPRHGRYH